MTRNEKKYAARYLEAWNRYGNNLPNEEYDRLSLLRRQLGIRLARAQEVEREIIIEAAGGTTVPLRKTQLLKGDEASMRYDLATLSSPLTTKPYDQILGEVAQYEATIDEILNEVSDVSEKMESIKKQLISVSGSLIKESIRLMRRKHHHSGKSKTGLIVSASGAALGLAAYVFQSYRQRIIEKKRSEKLDELLLKKKEIAEVRLETIQQLRDSFKRTIVPRMAKLYDKEFHEEIAIDDPIRQQKVDSFRRDFVLAVKTRYLEAILDYVVAEMQSWLESKQNSGLPRPDINKVIYPYPIYLMFSDPYMTRTYVGLDIQSVSNATEPLLQLEYKEEEKMVRLEGTCIPMQHILEQNPYYRDCKRLLEDSINAIGIGPQGLGGSSSVLGVNIEYSVRHTATIGVAVNFGCWTHRRGHIIFDSDLNCATDTHHGFTCGY